MIVKENELDMIKISMKLLADASYNRGKPEMSLTHLQDFEKWRDAYINALLDAANIKTEESSGGCENGACEIHYKD